MSGEGDAGGEGALRIALLPEDVVVRLDGAQVIGSGGLSVVGLGAGRVVLSRRRSEWADG